MAGAAGQAAGLAVGAAVGSIVPGIGTYAGAAIGASGAGYFMERGANKIQRSLDESALRVNREQARLKAAEASSIHATNFRQALASQVALASMRGGSGSLTTQFGQQAYRSFLQDQKAIELGLSVSELQGSLQEAGLSAASYTRDVAAGTRFASSALGAINLNLLKSRGT